MPRHTLITSLCCIVWLALSAATASAQSGGETPRQALVGFLEATRDARYADAAAYLELDDRTRARGPELARRLKAVVDRHIWFEPARVNDTPEGDQGDGKRAGIEELGVIPGAHGNSEPITMVRGADGTWRFSAGVVSRIDVWFRDLPNHWIQDRLPGWLLRSGPLELLWWQWMAMPVLLVLGYVLGSVLGRVTRFVLGRLVKRTDIAWDDAILAATTRPLRWAWTLIVFRSLVGLLGLYAPADRWIGGGIRGLLLLCLFWGVIRILDEIRHSVTSSPWAKEQPVARSLVPLAVRVIKAVVIVIAVISMLSELGYPVAGLIAGLGIGGIAIALAAQKTIENLFGAFAIGVDQPFREGDFVRVDQHLGTIEAIGLRSTRIRTLDRTTVTVPNAQVAEARVESYAERDRIRMAITIGVVYETTGAQLQQIMDGFLAALKADARVWQDTIVVRFEGFGASSLDIEIMTWFNTTNYDVFRDIRQDLLLKFIEVVEGAGSSFAFPTQTLHVASLPSEITAPPAPARG